jgi:PAS domain S-box-containing protein
MTAAFVAPPGQALPIDRERVAADAPGFTAATALLVALLYAIGAEVGFAFKIGSVPTSIFWLPNSTMFAVFLLASPRRWWVYLVAALPAHLAVLLRHSVPVPAVLLLFVTNCGDGILGATLVRRFSRPSNCRFDGFRSVLVFLACAIGAPLVVSFADAATMLVTGLSREFWQVWSTRLRSNVLTNVLWVPAFVITATRGRTWVRDLGAARYAEAALLMAALLMVGRMVFGWPAIGAVGAIRSIGEGVTTASLYAPLPLLLWAAVRFGTAGVSLSLLGFAFLVIWNVTHGQGPFAGHSVSTSVLAVQLFLTLLSMPSLLLAALLEERRRSADSLAEREAEYRSIFESTGDGVFITDAAHAVVSANPAFCRLTGYGLRRLRATDLGRIFHLTDLQPFDAHLARASTSDETITQAMCVREDGGISLFEILSRRFSYRALPHVLSVVRDVTERERAYQELEQRVAERTRALSTLLEFSKTIASTLEPRTLLDGVLEQMRTIIDYTGATIFVRETEDADMLILAHRGPLAAADAATVRIAASEIADCLPLREKVPIVVDDLRGDSPAAKACVNGTPQAVQRLFGYARSLMLVPLIAGDRAIGLLRIDHAEPNRYHMSDAALALALAGQAAIALDNARLYEQARDLAAFEERQRLARELHDSVTQTLCALAMLGKILPATWERSPEEGRKSVINLDEMAQSALAEMRTLLLELRPDTLYEANLNELLHQLAEAQRSRMRAPITVDVDGGATPLPPDVHVAFYRVAQEALSNAGKHASAPHVRIALKSSAEGATLSVRDDGVGFSPADTPAGPLGIVTMRERAESVGARFTVDSAPGKGTAVIVSWPGDARN